MKLLFSLFTLSAIFPSLKLRTKKLWILIYEENILKFLPLKKQCLYFVYTTNADQIEIMILILILMPV